MRKSVDRGTGEDVIGATENRGRQCRRRSLLCSSMRYNRTIDWPAALA